MDEKTVEAILSAVKSGLDVVISAGKDGELKIKTVQLKKLRTKDRCPRQR